MSDSVEMSLFFFAAVVVSVPVTTTVATPTVNQQNYLTTADTSQSNITTTVSLPVTRCFECGEVFQNAAMLQVQKTYIYSILMLLQNWIIPVISKIKSQNWILSGLNKPKTYSRNSLKESLHVLLRLYLFFLMFWTTNFPNLMSFHVFSITSLPLIQFFAQLI